MAGDLGVRLLALRCDALVDATTTAIEDLVDYFDADLIYIVDEKLDIRTVSTVQRTASCPVIYTRGSAVHTETVDGITVSIVRSLYFIGGASTASGQEIPDDVDYVICDEIQTSADSVSLDVSLDGLVDIRDLDILVFLVPEPLEGLHVLLDVLVLDLIPRPVDFESLVVAVPRVVGLVDAALERDSVPVGVGCDAELGVEDT